MKFSFIFGTFQTRDQRLNPLVCAQRAGQWFRDRMVEEEGELIQKLKDKGMQITQPDVAKFRDAMQPAYERIG